jgi:ABC-2 type transport system ATP-binding protein
MSEMALAADHLIIIGRGRLLANTTTEAFINANARKDVFVRSPHAGELARSLLGAGAGVTTEGDNAFCVAGLESYAIAELAAAGRFSATN